MFKSLFFVKKDNMTQLKFDKKGFLIPQKINYDVKHNEKDKELIDKYIKKKTNFRIDYDHKGNPIFKEKKLKEIK